MPSAGRVVRVRVRGVYATALTGLLLDSGFQVVQASRVISERMSIPQLRLPADATVKNNDRDPGEVLVIGYPWAVEEVLRAFREKLKYSLYLKGLLPVHATIVATVKGWEQGVCKAVVRGVEVLVTGVSAEDCVAGERIVGFVRRTGVRGGEKPVVEPGVKVVGDYAMLYKQPGRVVVTISEHVRSPERRALLHAIASEYTSRGFSVHWRSSSGVAEDEKLVEELKLLAERIEELEKRVREAGEEGVYSEGEDVALVALSSIDKEFLDSVRARYVPTTPLHHMIKSVDQELSPIVDFADTLVACCVERERMRRGIVEYIATELRRRGRVRLLHQKLDGNVLKLGEPFVSFVEVRDAGISLVLRRSVRSPGIYDGLGVEKKPGDVIETSVETGEWRIVHRYYSADGELKGVYVNINTPPEILPSVIRYIDLEVDVVKLPGSKPRLVDLEALEEAYRSKRVTREVVEKVAETVKRESEELGEQVETIL